MLNKILTDKEFLGISRELETYHVIFSKIWEIGKPVFTDEISTTSVEFDRNGKFFNFKFNPVFWNEISEYERIFVICHECLHIILNHGIRLKKLDKDLGNIAADVVINEMLVSGFGLDKTKLISLIENGCWLDVVFEDKKVDVDRSLEYYYLLLQKESEKQIGKLIGENGIKSIDSHEGICNIDMDEVRDALDGVIKAMNDVDKKLLNDIFNRNNNDEEVTECNKTAGSIPGKIEKIINLGYIKKKKKWETIIKNWANKILKVNDRDFEQWARINRRLTTINTDLFLPSDMEIEKKDKIKGRIKIVFFQDTSGSCLHLAERFFKASKSLPTNRFEVFFYCFDTQVYETSLKSDKLYGFGGTSFSILEEYVWNNIAKGDEKQYAKAVFVITDGSGNQITPRKPKNWYWFLSENNTSCIPKECNIYKLADFE